MTNTFTDLTTDSKPESQNWQSGRANDSFEKITPGSHPSPDSGRWDIVPVAGADSKGVDIPPAPKPRL